MSREQAADLLDRAIAERVFPAAVAEVGHSHGIIWRQAFGTLFYPRTDPSASDVEQNAPAAVEGTIFDLASLTKPLSTATLAVQLIQDRALALEDLVGRHVPEWRGVDRESVTIRDLLEHSSGLPARLVDRPPATAREFEHDICALALEYVPRTRSVYSDLGFILLGFLLRRVKQQAVAAQFQSLWASLDPETSEFVGALNGPDGRRRSPETPAGRRPGASAAPTRPLDDDARRGEILHGKVHDNYAAAIHEDLAGHAGLFGNAAGVGRFARAMLRGARGEGAASGPFSNGGVRLATTKTNVPGSSRALGWDTMLPTSSCGERLSPSAFGHTGFTGTSLWIDPQLDRYFVLLTNCAYGTGTPDQMRAVRRGFHDALASLDG